MVMAPDTSLIRFSKLLECRIVSIFGLRNMVISL
jgi:hypothetical protein